MVQVILETTDNYKVLGILGNGWLLSLLAKMLQIIWLSHFIYYSLFPLD